MRRELMARASQLCGTRPQQLRAERAVCDPWRTSSRAVVTQTNVELVRATSPSSRTRNHAAV